ncbi:7693_t:CDS:2 [Acaulospora morrowiae]|uniref:7693_t:CDS:1 n=1 Tax=Acaulospora morrowiae TaxID=94023 RepID=A0A9N9BIA5_9GLOM|nr:7693_t:CDS:2 [Acaulospora morrowiae]
MPPKKAPIYCLVHGDPENSVFGIKYDKNTTVDELKDAIKVKLSPLLDGVSVKDLTLYQVNIDLNTQNLQRTALTNPNANIVGDMGGQVLRPMDNIEEKFPTPANGHIHVIVDVPAPPVAVATNRGSANEEIRNDIKEMKKDIKDMKREKSEVNISSVNYESWERIRAYLGLDYEAMTDLDMELTTERTNAFQWSVLTERAQRDGEQGYLNHLRTILQIATFRGLGLCDATNETSLLSTGNDILPIKLSGTTDVAIVDRHSIALQMPEKHIRILFKLKKVIVKADTYQVMAELITADLKSIYSVLAVLTDLNDDWRFYWLEEGRIKALKLPRDSAVALIKHNMSLADQELDQQEAEIEEPLPKRMKLKHIVAPNVSSDIAPMEDFFDTMTEENIFKYKTKRMLTQFFSQPIFNDIQKKLPLQADAENNGLD